MRTDQDLFASYADILDPEDADLVSVVRDLEVLLPVRKPPASVETRVRATMRAGRRRPRAPWLQLLFQSTRPRSAGGLGVLLLLVVALVGTAAYAATTWIRVLPPEQHNAGARGTAIVGMFFPPPGYAQYRPVEPKRAARESGLAVAYLQPPPAGLDRSVGVWFPAVCKQRFPTPRSRPSSEGISLAIRSVVQYQQGDHHLLVALDQPSPGLMRQPLLLGQHTVRLSNGHLAWTSVLPQSGESNTVATVAGDYVVVLASDVSMARVQQLTTTAVVVPPSGKPATRHIPASWPSPLPAARSPRGAVISVRRQDSRVRTSGSYLYLTFLFNIGNSGSRTASDLDTVVELPSYLASRSLDRPLRTHFSDLKPGSGGGFGGNMRVHVDGMSPADVRRALEQGIQVRVRWIEARHRRQRAFTFPLALTPSR